MSTSPAGIYAQVIVTMQDSQNANDQNLLFGMLAFQLDFITQKQLIETMQAWMLDKSRPLGALFVERQLMAPDRERLLSSLVACAHWRARKRPAKKLGGDEIA